MRDDSDREGRLLINGDSCFIIETDGRKIPVSNVLAFAGFNTGDDVKTFGGDGSLTIATPATAEKMTRQLEMAELATKIMRGDTSLVGMFVIVDYGRLGWARLEGEIHRVDNGNHHTPCVSVKSMPKGILRPQWLFDPKATVVVASNQEEAELILAARLAAKSPHDIDTD
ncbi:MAG: hypothetical protein WCG99_02460 [Candidatus Berkelbacteria bacterium]